MKKFSFLMFPLFTVTFLASCNNKTITITWKNYDGTILEKDKNVKKGTIPTYDGTIPDRPYDTNHYYSFVGWDPEIKEVTKSQTYTAQYREIDITGIDAYIRISIPNDAEEKTFTFDCESDSTPVIDWGDGSNSNATPTHDYQKSGDYDIKIKNVTCVSLSYEDCYTTELFLNDNITSLGSISWDSKSLTSVTIGKKANSGSDNPFQYCPLLSKIVVNKDNPYIDSRDNCNALITKVESTYFKPNTLFCGCNSTIIPDSVTEVGPCAFTGSGITSITIPSGIKSFGDYPFSGCLNLSKIVVDKNNEYFDSRDNCNAVVTTKDVENSSGNTISADSLVIGCKSTIIPNTVTSIFEVAFYETSIESMIIPNSVTSIGGSAFSYCDFLTSVTISNSVNSIKEAAFVECHSLALVDLTTYTPASEIPMLPIGNVYPFRNCSPDLKFKVASEDMANTFKNCGKNWPGDLDSYTWPGKSNSKI